MLTGFLWNSTSKRVQQAIGSELLIRILKALTTFMTPKMRLACLPCPTRFRVVRSWSLFEYERERNASVSGRPKIRSVARRQGRVSNASRGEAAWPIVLKSRYPLYWDGARKILPILGRVA